MSSKAQRRRIALVTGAGGGIGRAVSIALAGENYAVVLAGRTLSRLHETAELCASQDTLVVEMDVTQPRDVAALFLEIRSRYGRLDLLFNNAGVALPALEIEDVSFSDWRRVIDTCLTGAFLCTQAAVALMKSQAPQGGRIINNGSVSAKVPRPKSAAYTAAKHGLTGLTKSTALDGRAFNIACGQIDIGNAATHMAAGLMEGALQADGSTRSEPTIQADLVARAVAQMAELPLEANIPFMTLMATQMPLVGRG